MPRPPRRRHSSPLSGLQEKFAAAAADVEQSPEALRRPAVEEAAEERAPTLVDVIAAAIVVVKVVVVHQLDVGKFLTHHLGAAVGGGVVHRHDLDQVTLSPGGPQGAPERVAGRPSIIQQ